MALYPEDFDLRERLEFEKQYLGYYWHSPLDLYETRGGLTILAAKESPTGKAKIECVVESLSRAKTKTGSAMGRLKVSDGLSDCTIILWARQLEILSPYLKEGFGMSIDVKYDAARSSFTLAYESTVPIPLRLKPQYRISNEESE
jgi:DNA polymerase III alpha subunit